ncbi:anaerobic ribonucleotide reductase-activating protein [Enhygromyxa salina]|uniref:Anaerobic ribonucleotide reductase-activating protein n=1 Tax=Enhygromyxa salina TaxID=215803 RepID=A0A2S9XCW9_9BACT|nr:4Fe-4S single cluster domain-containing protein [Enhygromyxa salina]PRP90703.1 anaerobic ribonucleotide reductase-activating protein [Enhygromyxa salina]
MAPRAPSHAAVDELARIVEIGVEIADTEAEGPGRRYAIWVQGCPMRCPGCCNPELLRFDGGRPSTVRSLLERILAAHARTPLDGISLLGGEPFAQPAALAVLAEQVQAAGLGVMVYSGFTLDELRAKIETGAEPGVARLLAATDLLVDGRYLRDQPDAARRWIGSTNQRLHFLSDRHHLAEPAFGGGETIELRLVDGELIINGWPWGKGLPPSREDGPPR